MAIFKGLIFVKHGAVGTKSEGPVYFLQTRTKDLLIEFKERNMWEPDYHLEFFSRRIVEIEGEVTDPERLKLITIKEILSTTLP